MSAASLKVTSTARPGSRLAVEVAIPAERSKASYEAAISQLSRSVNLPGFRKGKVPRTVLVQQLGGLRIRATARAATCALLYPAMLLGEARHGHFGSAGAGGSGGPLCAGGG